MIRVKADQRDTEAIVLLMRMTDQPLACCHCCHCCHCLSIRGLGWQPESVLKCLPGGDAEKKNLQLSQDR